MEEERIGKWRLEGRWRKRGQVRIGVESEGKRKAENRRWIRM